MDDKLYNYFITISYDGKNYHGWQIQSNALAVQEVFQKAARKIVGDDFTLKGCSRTDSGVHAYMYCISLLCKRDIPPKRLISALNGQLPMDIAVLDAKRVPLSFHARYHCKGKQYIYKIWNSPIRDPFSDGYVLHYRWKLDENLLNKAAKAFVGKHDFSAFCTFDNREKGDMVRTVTRAEVYREGDTVYFLVEADGFLYNMVRIMVGTLLRVAQGKIAYDEIPFIIESKQRKNAGPTAPPQGLYLNKVFYDEESIQNE